MADKIVKKIKWSFLSTRYSLLNGFNRQKYLNTACRDCIKHGDGCCVYPFFYGWKIILLPHEIKRIAAFTGRDPGSFVDDTPLVESQREYYCDDSGDPDWSRLFHLWDRPTGLKGACPFLTPQGCTLPYNTKPLLCQVYPLTFNISDAAIFRIPDPDCLLIQASSCAGDVLHYFKDNHEGLSSRFEEYRRDFYNLLGSLQ
jgi:hypothetical protein